MRNLLLPVVLAPLASCVVRIGDSWDDPAYWVEATETFTVPASDLRSMSCTTRNGRIVAAGVGAGREVRVAVHKRGGGDSRKDAEAALAAILVERGVHDGELALRWSWRPERRRSWRGSVSFDVEFPASLSVAVESHNGEIRLRGAEGTAKVTSHNGAVEVSGPMRDLHAQTHNGNVYANFGSTGAVSARFDTHNGDVNVRLDPAASVRVQCSTHNGAVTSGLALRDEFRGRNFFTGVLGAGEGELRVETHNGNVRVD
jgi:hypothetical protein